MKHTPLARVLAGSTALARPRAITGAVRADMTDANKVLAELAQAFEAFKAENDKSLKAKADVIVAEKIDRIAPLLDKKLIRLLAL